MFNSLANKFLFNFAKDKPIYIFATLILSLSNAVLDVIGAVLLVLGLVIVLGNTGELNFSGYSPIINFFTYFDYFKSNFSAIELISAIAVTFIFKYMAIYGYKIIEIEYKFYLITRLKTKGINLLLRASINYFEQNKVENILLNLNREIATTASVVQYYIQVFAGSISIIFYTVILLLVSIQLTVVSLVVFSIYLCIDSFMRMQLNESNFILFQKTKKYNRQLINFLLGIREIKFAGNEIEEYEKTANTIQSQNQSEKNNWTSQILINFVQKINNVTIITILFVSSYYLNYRLLESLIVASIYICILFCLIFCVKKFNNAFTQIANNKNSVLIVANFLNEVNKSRVKSGELSFSELQNSIELQNVTFAYPNHARVVLDKINISIAKGSTIAIFGSSGAGKSTIASLISRVYDPIEGKVLIDNIDIKKYNLTSLRQAISIIDKSPFLFNNTIEYNLTCGIKNVSKTEIIAAAKTARAYYLITQLPEGLHTNIDDNRISLSAKQKQLIAITRALLSNPKIIILDEPTDTLNEADQKFVQNVLDELCRDRTTIVLTNKIEIAKKADRIIVLNKGKIVESGTHQELLKNGNIYKSMCYAKFRNSQQNRQHQLAKKISKKLARQNNLSTEIRNDINSLLSNLESIDRSLAKSDLEQKIVLDKSYQSAKNMLASLREYHQKISQRFKKNDE